jgi:intein/homing endonuclease/phage/plasmid-associated DNA primase
MMDHKVIDKFWELYCGKLKENPEVIHGLAENPQQDPKTFIPIIIDIDLHVHAEGEPRLLYTKDDISTLVDILQRKINDIFEVNHQDLNCFLLEKPPRRDSGSGDIKSGFHLHFPIFVRKQAIISELYPRVVKEIDDVSLFEDYGGSDVLDQGMPTKCPLIYGGRKTVDQKSYVCTRAYDPEGEEFNIIDEALQGYKLYDSKGNLLHPSIANLPRIFSIFISGRQAHELKPDVHKKEERQVVQIADYTTDEIERNLEDASAILPMLKRERSDDYNNWLRVGFILFNISGACLSLEETVLMGDRTRKKIKNVAIGDEVVCFDPNTCKTSVTKVIHQFVKEADNRVYKLTTCSGREIIATEDHRFLTSEGWMAVGDVKIGETKIGILCQPDEMSYEVKQIECILTEEKFTEELKYHQLSDCLINTHLSILKSLGFIPLFNNDARLAILAGFFGFLMTDGWIGITQRNRRGKIYDTPELSACFATKFDAEIFEEDVVKLGFKKTKIYEQTNEIHGYVHHAWEIHHGSALPSLLISLGIITGMKTEQERKLLPNWIDNGSNIVKREFISAFMGGDGCEINVAKKGNSYGFNCGNTSQSINPLYKKSLLSLMKQCAQILEDFGIEITYVKETKRNEENNRVIISFKMSASHENLIKYFKRIGYKYSRYKIVNSAKVVEYLMKKKRLIEEHVKLVESVRQYHDMKKSKTEIAKLLNINERSVLEIVDRYNNGRKIGTPNLNMTENNYKNWSNIIEDKSYSIFIPIESIEEVKEALVADITVESDNHSFIGGDGFLSSNCRRGLQLWIDFSRRTVRKDMMSEESCTAQWTKMTKGTLTIGTLLFYAKKDSPREYAAYIDRKLGEKIQSDCEGIYYNLACYVHSMCLDEYVCVLPSSSKMGSWYCWDEILHIWKRDTQVPLERRLPGILTEKLDLEIQRCHKELGETKQNSPEAKTLNARMELFKKTKRDILDKRCKRTDIMKDCADMFYDTDFLGMLDRNTEIIPFNNGTFDLRSMVFRESVREDYCTKTVGYSYREFELESPEINAVDEFMMKVYPDPNLREYAMTFFCSLLKGGNFNKTFMIFKGTGNNAKSAVIELLNQTLGPFSATLPTAFITGRRTQSSSATPEVYRNMHTRLVVLQEPNKGEALNSGIVKEITGNDRMYVRGLFEEGLEFRPQFKVVLVCVEENTKVSLNNGISLSIKNLVNNKQKVLSWDSETNGLLPTTQHLLIDKGEQECIKLTLLDGRQITCTPDHKFLTNNNSWIEAKDIKNDTYLKMGIDNPSCDDIFNEYNYNIKLGKYSFDLSKLDDKLKFMAYARLVGFMLADGSRNCMVCVGHIIDGNSVLDDIKLLTGKTPSLSKNRNVFRTDFPCELRDSVCSFLDIQYGGRVNNKMQLPSFIFDDDCPTFIIREFIAGMFGGDGIIVLRKAQNRECALRIRPPIHENRFGTLSLIASKIDEHVDSLVNSFNELSKLLLKRFNISSNISIIPYKDENKQYVYLNISKSSSILKFCENIGFRYCCHKSHRCMAITSYLKYRNYVIEYNKKIIIRTKELFDKYNKQNPKPKILQLDKNTGEIINTYNSTQDVENKLGIRHGCVRSAIKREGSSGGFLWKEKVENTEILDGIGCKTLKMASSPSDLLRRSRLTAIKETIAKNGIIDKEHIITYSQVRRYIHDNIEYKSPISTNIRKYMKQCGLEQFCNDGKKIKYSVNRDRLTLPCYRIPVIHIENVGIKHVYDINVDEPYSNFIADGIVTHNCNEEPMVPSEDLAFWKRARVLPHESVFDESYPESQDEQFEKKIFPIDKRFWEKIPGMVQAFMWKLIRKYEETKGGVIKIEPQKVLSATSRYRRANDRYKSFAEEVMVYDKGTYVTIADAYSRFKEWLREGFPGIRAPDKNHFKEQLSRYLGSDPTGRGWENYKLRELDEPADDKDVNGINRFIEECTEESISNSPFRDMYDNYCKWCAKKGVEIGDEAAIKSKLEIIGQMVVRRALKDRNRQEQDNNNSSNSSSPPNPLGYLDGTFRISDPPLIVNGDPKLRSKMKKEMSIVDDNVSEEDDSSDEEEEDD